jgi:F-type H+-transporting ATPase subunit b
VARVEEVPEKEFSRGIPPAAGSRFDSVAVAARVELVPFPFVEKLASLRLPVLLLVAMVSIFSGQSAHALQAAPAPATAQSSEATAAKQKPDAAPSEPRKDEEAAGTPPTFGGELAKETRESTGEEEEHADLKHAASVQWLGRKLGLNVHQAHLAALSFNFAVVAAVILWAGFKFLPGVFRNRSAGIQQALEEARAASQDANRRLADIENRLQQLGVEVGQMTANAEKETAAEEARIQKAAEEDVRKVVLAAEQEIATAAKQARRELSAHTASLAVALATQQIKIDSNTDQVLVRSFASTLASDNDKNGGKGGK